MPKVSVIIPVYNAAAHLRECIDSVLGQTLKDFEVWCVDDGSTDESLEILAEYAAADPRLKVIEQRNAGAGAARNAALAVATGEYLCFLDADDFFVYTMLANMYRPCVAKRADIGLCQTRYFDTRTGASSPANGVLKMEYLPAVDPFSRADIPDHLLYFVSPAPWNKMFRRQFVLDRQLQFQNTKRANDLLFTRLALALAERITVIEEALVHYRVGTEFNLQSGNHETPLDFYTALSGLKQRLEEEGVYGELERSFVNDALSNSLYNLNSLQTPDSFRELFALLRSEIFPALGIDGHPAEYFFNERQYEQYLMVVSMTPQEYLFETSRELRDRLERSRENVQRTFVKLHAAQAERTMIEASSWYRAARRIARLSKRLKRATSRGAR